MKKFLVYLFAFLTICSAGFAFPVLAEENGEVKAAVAVAATVPSDVCPQYSNVGINVTEILADASQKATITVTLKDCSQVPMADIDVEISTDRGGIDILKYVDENGNVQASGDGNGVRGKTDANGFAFFQISSRVPGKTTIRTKVDNLVDLNNLTLTFTSLPFPKTVTISVEVPKFIAPSGKITIFKPSQTDNVVNEEELVNLGVEVIIPQWSVVLGVGAVSLNFLLFIIIIVLIRRVKKIDIREEKIIENQEVLVEEIAQKEGIQVNKDQNLPQG